MHKIRQGGAANMYYLDEMWVNQNNICKSCWKGSERSSVLEVPIGKGSRLIIHHAGSANRSLVMESKSIFPPI
jgi:hypothetical protein